ncbi:hypothetical protein M409DRAFT_18065 [Zasmidium cellare ATCC 36951]|uniref:F-box domain-containing protein n=1 Tax=Zasmidium cellare ATCC 36951 TaxID=1080233 RepID=A0A6A6CXJ1_ZASCE|nr:uncharacterized protein M409DRAFT_18065 [Zasmidium cellare ATCC 36951]KAF2171831.1 hypothetical protein M409DRAFT_18065 [Zasmidium cellare ATCC 36951]
MATFLDLPKELRERIYRLHLVYDEPITNKKHHRIVKHNSRRRRAKRKHSMPPICTVSPKIEKEAASIYYGENHFDIGHIGDVHRECKFFDCTPLRHLKHLRSVTCTWANTVPDTWYGPGRYGGYGQVGENWRRLSNLKSLVELNIRVDEADIIKSMSIGRGVRQQSHVKEEVLTPQQSLAIFRFPSIAGLLSISGVENANFIQLENDMGEKYGGPFAGGPLETHILPRLRASQLQPKRFLKKRPFRLLDLPAELRNRIYDCILRIPGPIHLSTEAPTTAAKNPDRPKANESKQSESALNLLLVNKQIHDESIGLFYNCNAFIFYYPIQLHAFLLGIGDQRKSLLRDLTIDYYNLKCGGVDLIDITFPLLHQLTGLRRLHVVMKSQLHETTLRQGWPKTSGGWMARSNLRLGDANPNLIPGIKHLFNLRGVTDIKIRDVELEKKVAETEKQPSYPDFWENTDHWVVMQLSRVFEHFNLALAAAQSGDFNDEVLTSKDWHTKETFPPLKIVDEEEEAEGKGGDGNTSDDDSLTELSDADFDSDYDFGW